jgi:hypothetical protein
MEASFVNVSFATSGPALRSQLHYAYRDLPSKLKARLAHSLTRRGNFAHTDAPSNLVFYGLHGAGLLVALWLLRILLAAGYGDPLDGAGWESRGFIVVDILMTAAITLLVLRCLRRYSLTRRFGFAPGRYVLPLSIVDANATRITVTDLLQLKTLDIAHTTANGSHTKSTLAFSMNDGKLQLFTFRNKNRAEAAYDRFYALQGETRQAFEERDLDKLKRLDPLVELRKNKWALPPGRRISAPPTRWQGLRANHAFACVAVALAAGPVLWLFRTAAGDVQMHKTAQAMNTEAAYLGYLARGQFYAGPMRAALPRVSLGEVISQNSVTALRHLLERYPGAGLEPEVATAIHVQYQRSLEKFTQQAVRTDPALLEAMAGLLAQVEARGDPTLPVRFVRPSSEQLVELDRSLAKRGAIDGRRIIPASAYFAHDSAASRETRIVAGLQSAFRTIFPHDVLMLVGGAPRDNTQPVLDIHYEIEPSGVMYVSRTDDRRGFVGLRVRFDSALIASATAPQWRFQLDVKPPDHFTVQYKDGGAGGTGAPQDGQVYAVMAERAFDALGGAITAAFFRPDSDVMLQTLRKEAMRQAPGKTGS